MFANMNLIDILLVGALVYLVVRFIRNHRDVSGEGDKDNVSRPDFSRTRQDSPDKPTVPMDRHAVARNAWSHLGADMTAANTTPSGPGERLPFDRGEFLEGAKLFFSRVHQADDLEELESLRSFMSDEVFAELSGRLGNETPQGEIMLLDARLMDTATLADRTRTTVFFDAHMRANNGGGQTMHLRTAWEFVREEKTPGALWTLDKIHKVDQ